MYHSKKDLVSDVVKGSDIVLDVGFAGQALQENASDWPHAFLKERAREVYGLDLELPDTYTDDPHYAAASAENFSFPLQFDVIFAGDLIEHLSNPGLFLDSCKRHLKQGGRLILTTPNTFSFFSLIEKLTHDEPNINPDHTFYFNKRTITVLLAKNGWSVAEFSTMYDMLGTLWQGGWKRKLLASIYYLLSTLTEKFATTMVVIAQPST